MNQLKPRIFLFFFMVCAVYATAQKHNSVPLDHPAYDVIEMGVMWGVITPPSSSKPWSFAAVQEKLREMIDNQTGVFTSIEIETLVRVLDSLDRRGYGFGWESNFSTQAVGDSPVSVNLARMYAEGDVKDIVSWNLTALGQIMHRERGELSGTAYSAAGASFFPNTTSKMWDGGAFSFCNSNTYLGLEGELNIFVDDSMQLRIGRIRRDLGPETDGSSLFINTRARPFCAFEWMVSPSSWLDYYILVGALEYNRENEQWRDDGPFRNLLSVLWIEVNPLKYLHVGVGGSALLDHASNLAFFTNLDFRLPGILKLWGSLFVDNLDSVSENFFLNNSTIYAIQGGVKAIIRWLPFGAFTLRYTKVEPYCYTDSYAGNAGIGSPSLCSLINDGDSLGFYLPPNSDELLLRVESGLSSRLKAHIQFQMMRHGADYGYGAVGGSSLRDKYDNVIQYKYFLMDGVYRWDNVIKLGCIWKAHIGNMPVSVNAETGFVSRRFTINGKAGVGNEAEYESLDDSVYRAGKGLIFSIGFRLYPL